MRRDRGEHVGALVQPVAVLDVGFEARRGQRASTRLTIGSWVWKLIEPSSQMAAATPSAAGTSMRRPTGEMPSSITSSSPSTAAIQNERR